MRLAMGWNGITGLTGTYAMTRQMLVDARLAGFCLNDVCFHMVCFLDTGICGHARLKTAMARIILQKRGFRPC